jgi:hypothetical protein
MTDEQKRTRLGLEQLWKADPQAVRKAFDELVGYIRHDPDMTEPFAMCASGG